MACGAVLELPPYNSDTYYVDMPPVREMINDTLNEFH